MRTLPAASAAVGALLLWATLSAARPAETTSTKPVIEISGQVRQTHAVTREDLQKVPQTSVSLSFVTAHGTEAATYTGALLWTVLLATPFADGPQKNAKLQHKVLVTGRDGYAVAVSVGEIDPDFEGKTVILATAKDGKALDAADGIRLIVPNDRHGGRAVRDVVSLRIE
jgi:hypothetical protein